MMQGTRDMPTAEPDRTTFVDFAAALASSSRGATSREVWLEHAAPRKGPEGALVPFKVCVTLSESLLRNCERLRPVLEASEPGQVLHVPIDGSSVSLESVSQALDWQSLSAAERKAMTESAPWHSTSALMHAAHWLGSAALLAACERALHAHLCLDNAVRLALASERCGAQALLTACFFLLKCFFCADSAESRRGRTARLHGPAPRRGRTAASPPPRPPARHRL
jgi:hypothetical protein